jgi:hypothetical protein
VATLTQAHHHAVMVLLKIISLFDNNPEDKAKLLSDPLIAQMFNLDPFEAVKHMNGVLYYFYTGHTEMISKYPYLYDAQNIATFKMVFKLPNWSTYNCLPIEFYAGLADKTVKYMNRDGRPVIHFDQPTERVK